jgi:hypothetical protein
MSPGATPAYWADLGRLLGIAEKHEVYVLATLMSFDNFKSTNHNFRRWRKWIGTDDGIDSYVRNFLHPLLERYGRAPRLWAIDLMNEPEWVFENAEDGNIPWRRLQSYFARAASEIHRESAVLVTIGMAMPKYNSDVVKSAQGNRVGDPPCACIQRPRGAIGFLFHALLRLVWAPLGQCAVSVAAGIRAADRQTVHHRGVSRAWNQGPHRHGLTTRTRSRTAGRARWAGLRTRWTTTAGSPSWERRRLRSSGCTPAWSILGEANDARQGVGVAASWTLRQRLGENQLCGPRTRLQRSAVRPCAAHADLQAEVGRQ